MMLLFASGSFTLVVIYSCIRKLKSILLFVDTILIGLVLLHANLSAIIAGTQKS